MTKLDIVDKFMHLYYIYQCHIIQLNNAEITELNTLFNKSFEELIK